MDVNESDSLVLVVPEGVARALRSEGLGSQVELIRHDPGAAEVVLTVLGATSSVVTLLVSWPDIRRVADVLAGWLKRTDGNVEHVTVEAGDERRVLSEGDAEALLAAIESLRDTVATDRPN